MVRGYNAFADVSLTASYQAPSHIDDMCAQQGPRTDGRLVAGETICLGAQAPMWFSIENARRSAKCAYRNGPWQWRFNAGIGRMTAGPLTAAMLRPAAIHQETWSVYR